MPHALTPSRPLRAVVRPLLSCALALGAAALPSCGDARVGDDAPTLGQASQPVADTSNTDILADAPFRVQSPDTTIPFEIFVSDAWTRTTTLNSVKISLLEGSSWTTLYQRALGLDLSSSAATNEMWLLHVTKAYGGAIPNGTLLTPANLIGAGAAGKTLQFKVEIDADVSLRSSSAYTIVLNVHVGEAPLPHGRGLFTGWYAGDTHTHTMYTNNFAEFGLPHRAMLSAAHAVGLDWEITTDHSCDLDAPKSFPVPGFDRIGSRTEQWTFCEETTKAKPECVVRSHVGWANGWLMADDDAKDAMSWAAGVPFLFHTGEEVTAKTAGGVTVHTLAMRSGYVQADGSGATKLGIQADPITATLPGVLSSVPSNAVVFGAHPTQPLPSEVGGGAWSASDITSARSYPVFKGFEFWNLRKTKAYNAAQNPYGSGGLDPASHWTSCSSTDFECYPYFLDRDALPFWDGLLSGAVETAQPFVYGLAGTDAHGDLNFSTYYTGSTSTFDLDSTTDSALGHVRTVAFPKAYTIDAILDAIAGGHTILSDGPLLTFGVDETGDGTIDQATDTQVGDKKTVAQNANLDLRFKWQTSAEFGDLERVVLLRGTSSTGKTPGSYELLSDPEGLSDCKTAGRTAATCKVTLSHAGALALPTAGHTYYYRAMALSGGGNFRCLTNPIWITGGPDETPDAGPSDGGSDAGDTGVSDTGVSDTSVADTGALDSAAPDTNVLDTAAPDASAPDTNVTPEPDTGTAAAPVASDAGGCSCEAAGGRGEARLAGFALALPAIVIGLARRRRARALRGSGR
jgi:hypothetical protein